MALLDWFRPAKKEKKKEETPRRPEMDMLAAVSVLDRYSTFPSKGLTPDKLASYLQSAAVHGSLIHQAELFEDMEEKDAHLFSILQTRKQAVMGLEWQIQPYSEEQPDQEISEFITEVFCNIPNLEDNLLDLLDAIGKGYSVLEIHWKISGNKVLVEELEWIHPKKVTFWQSLTPRIIDVPGNWMGVEPPPWKIIYHRYKARSGHDTRAGVLRVVAWMYLFKNYAIKDWVSFCEIFGIPLRLGKYEASASQADREALLTALQALGTDAAGVISKNTEIEFVDASRNLGRSNPHQMLAEFCNREMSKAVLGQTLTTDTTGATGTYSTAKVHELVRHDILEADAEVLSRTLRSQLIRPLVGFNFGWDKPLPYFTWLDLEERVDLESLAKTYKTLAEIGYPLTQEHISEKFGIPLPEEGQRLVGPSLTPSLSPLKGAAQLPLRDGTALPLTRHDQQVFQIQEELDNLAEAALAASAEQVGRMLAPVKELIEKGESLEEIKMELMSVYPSLAVNDLAELLYQVQVLANLRGRMNG